jgi:hypothetical protein
MNPAGGRAPAGHALGMNGGGPGVAGGAGGVCGRPTSAVAHVPTQRSAFCASIRGWSAVASSSATAVAAAYCANAAFDAENRVPAVMNALLCGAPQPEVLVASRFSRADYAAPIQGDKAQHRPGFYKRRRRRNMVF